MLLDLIRKTITFLVLAAAGTVAWLSAHGLRYCCYDVEHGESIVGSLHNAKLSVAPLKRPQGLGSSPTPALEALM